MPWTINIYTGALENTGTGGGSAAPINAQYLTLATHATLTDERVFTPGPGLSAIDGGAGGLYTLNLDAGLVALASLGAGIAVSDGADGWTPRSIAVTDTATVDLTITNANGVAGNPTIQADVIVAGLNPLLDHGLLLGLTDDDHAQYTLRAGRTGTTNDTTLTTSVGGTGTLAGGTDVGATLTLVASTSGSAHTGFVRIDDAQDWWPSVPDPASGVGFTLAQFNATVAEPSGSQNKRMLDWNPTWVAGGSSTVGTGGTDGHRVIDVRGALSVSTFPVTDVFTVVDFETTFSSTNTNAPYSGFRRLFWDHSNTSTTGGAQFVTTPLAGHISFFSQPGFTADGAGVYFPVGTRIVGFEFQPSFNAFNGALLQGRDDPIGATVFAIRVEDALIGESGGGVVDIATYAALQVSDLTVGDLNLSLRSNGALVQMRHGGPAVFGANAAPTNASAVLEVQSTTRTFLNARMTTAQKTTLTGVAVADGMQLYDSDLARMQFRENGAWVGYANGSGAATQVAFWSDADTLTGKAAFIWTTATDTLSIGTGASIVDGNITTGGTTASIAVSGVTTPSRVAAQTETTSQWANFLALSHSTDPLIALARSRGTVGGGLAAVQSSDMLGRIDFHGYDGTDYEIGARIIAEVDGTPGSDDMPGRLIFLTTLDGAATPNEQMRISNNGATQMVVTAPTVTATFNCLNVLPNGATVTASLSPAIRALLFQNTLTFAAAATTIGQLFQAAPTITTSGASRALGPLIGLGVNATFTPASTHTITGTASRAVNHSPTFTDNGTAGSTATDVYGLRQAGNLNTNWTVTDWAAVKMINPGGSGGTLTRLGAIEVDDLTRGTSNYSLWSKGSDVIVSHAGGAAFATGTATFTALTNASVGLEVQGTTKALRLSQLTDAQRTTLAGVAVGDGMLLYDTTRNTMSARMHSNWLDLPGWYHIIVKSADQTVTNTTTLTDDTELQFSVGAEEVWHVDLFLGMSGNNAASDAKWGFTASGASFVVAQSNWNAVHYTAAAALTQVNATAFASTTEAVTGGTASVDAGTSTTIWPVRASYRFRASAAVTVKVQFALLAGAAVGRNAVMEAGSTLFARRIS